MRTFFEATPKQKQLADVGRGMMDFSEYYGNKHSLATVTDDGLRTLNQMSHVGYLLTHFGAQYGTNQSDFSDADRKLIVDFVNKKVDIEHK